MRPLRTPDVYVEEISLFPPSVAEVETAVPAFVGYTARATKITDKDLSMVPTKIKSLPDFEMYFGGAPAVVPKEVNLDEGYNFVSANFESRNFYLYDSLRLFFDNGGGKCYIVSVGNYEEDVSKEKLIAGVRELKKYDEPTMLLFPDAASLDAGALGEVQQQALMQCGDLMDRVGIFETRLDDPNGTLFRDKIGINNLKYGAAYTPWLNISVSKNIPYANVRDAIYVGGTKTSIEQLTTDKGIRDLVKLVETALEDISTVDAEMKDLLGTSKSINQGYQDLVAAYKDNKGLGKMGDIFEFIFSIPGLTEKLLDATSGVKGERLRKDIKDAIEGRLKKAYEELIANEKELDESVASDEYIASWGVDPDPAAIEWGGIFSSSAPGKSSIIPGVATTDEAKCDAIFPNVAKNFAIIRETVMGIVMSASNYASTYETSLYESFPLYRKILKGINETATTVPPSGAIAGVCAAVDNARGVWKAPANVSLAGVVGPVYQFDADETDNLNIDTNAGKSINAIRAFSGKGTLVWGARTLAGNDNEWRYISVRRFFNMVEESVKKSTYWAVFEPNDANTWVKVRGMIENYLMQKWRDGALAGATPKEAFFVRCGLGTTMNSQDILEGRMNVEIGMAVVRPAEFIVLKFSHKLQTS
ncbi:phage tail sheath family protein [Geotalea toluenoxydans]